MIIIVPEIMIQMIPDHEFTPQDRWYVWCNRMPCSLDQKGVPCQKNMPYCNNPADCSGKNACGGRK